MSNRHFYKNLTSVEDLSLIASEEHFQPLPKDWFVIVCDIQNSTQAINNGQYKQVNMIAALSIVGILNIHKEEEYPFVFGGDGMTALIPQELLEDTKKVLLEAQKVAKESYNLFLRIGYIPMDHPALQEHAIKVSKFAVCEQYNQAIIKGEGLQYAEELLKKDDTFYIHNTQSDLQVDFSGLECRWENIPSPKDETISVLIKSLKDDTIYQDALHTIGSVFGSKSERNPIQTTNIELSFNPKVLNTEAVLHTQNFLLKPLVILQLFMENILGTFLMSTGLGQWKHYKQHITQTTDTEKFDDMLRMVISATKSQSAQLETYLKEAFDKKELIYGIHKADSALMTCLIFERHGKHIHFVDSANGGYALAAKSMKQLQKKL